MLPADAVRGVDAGSWTSDPYVEARLLPRLVDSDVRATSSVRAGVLSPVWEEELILPNQTGAHSVQLRVFDKDLVSLKDDFLGEVVLKLPPRPPPPGAAAAQPGGADTHVEAHIVQGTFALACPASKRERVEGLMRAAQRPVTPDAPGALGQLTTRVSWGAGAACVDVNQRPALRSRVGSLRVTIHSAKGLPQKYGDHPFVHARLEQAVSCTPAAHKTCDPVYEGGKAVFVFDVTEATSELVLSVVDADNLHGNQVAGEVILPLTQLLPAGPTGLGASMIGPRLVEKAHAALRRPGAPPASEERSFTASLLPPRPVGEALLRPQLRPTPPLGWLRFSAHLTLTAGLPFCLAAPDALAREPPVGPDASAVFSVAALQASSGRLADCFLCPLLAPVRTLLLLQSWSHPRLSGGLLAWWTLGCLVFPWSMLVCAPLWLLLAPCLHGWASSLIHAGDVAPLCFEEVLASTRAAAERDAADAKLYAMQKSAEMKLLAEEERADPTVVDGLLKKSAAAATRARVCIPSHSPLTPSCSRRQSRWAPPSAP